MPKKKMKKIEEETVEEEVTEVAATESTTEKETEETQPQEKETVKTKLEKLKPMPISLHCNVCGAEKQAYNIKVDKKGTFLFELECGHKEAYDFKVELHGEKAVADFGK